LLTEGINELVSIRQSDATEFETMTVLTK